MDMDRPRFRISQKCFLLTKDNEILFMQTNTGKKRGMYELPGGHLEYDETMQNGLFREVYEETGIQLKQVTQITTIVASRRQLKIYYQTTIKKQAVLLSTEHQGYVWKNKEECKDLPFKDEHILSILKLLKT